MNNQKFSYEEIIQDYEVCQQSLKDLDKKEAPGYQAKRLSGLVWLSEAVDDFVTESTTDRWNIRYKI